MQAAACANCQAFVGDAAELEREIAGLKILSSAFGSVRAETGLCRVREAFCVADYLCHHWREKLPDTRVRDGADA